MERSCVERSNSLHNNVYFFYSFVYNPVSYTHLTLPTKA